MTVYDPKDELNEIYDQLDTHEHALARTEKWVRGRHVFVACVEGREPCHEVILVPVDVYEAMVAHPLYFITHP